jgi:hypothetical protein
MQTPNPHLLSLQATLTGKPGSSLRLVTRGMSPLAPMLLSLQAYAAAAAAGLGSQLCTFFFSLFPHVTPCSYTLIQNPIIT